jgi:hypothetical protein
MNETIFLDQIKQIGVGVAFIIFPLLFVFAFAVHPGLLHLVCLALRVSYSEPIKVESCSLDTCWSC